MVVGFFVLFFHSFFQTFFQMSTAPRTVTFEFSANLIGARETPWDEILEWYRREAEYCIQEESLPSLTIEHIGRGLFRGTFTPGEYTSSNPRLDIESFVNPDEDGNHPIRCGRREHLVHGELRSIDGVLVVH
jgi:hypothetical protein